jgi:hypothetical protein
MGFLGDGRVIGNAIHDTSIVIIIIICSLVLAAAVGAGESGIKFGNIYNVALITLSTSSHRPSHVWPALHPSPLHKQNGSSQSTMYATCAP